MDTVITVMQAVLGSLFIVGGLLKLTMPYAKYSSIRAVAWSKEFKPEHIRLLGALEMSGGIGLIVPLVMHAPEPLTPLAAVAMALYMSGAMATHLRREEYWNIVGNLIWLGLALFVAYKTLVEFAV